MTGDTLMTFFDVTSDGILLRVLTMATGNAWSPIVSSHREFELVPSSNLIYWFRVFQ